MVGNLPIQTEQTDMAAQVNRGLSPRRTSGTGGIGLRDQIIGLAFHLSKAGTKQQEDIFGACFNPCQNRK